MLQLVYLLEALPQLTQQLFVVFYGLAAPLVQFVQYVLALGHLSGAFYISRQHLVLYMSQVVIIQVCLLVVIIAQSHHLVVLAQHHGPLLVK